MNKSYNSITIVMNLEETETGYILETESVKGIKRFSTETKERLIDIINGICKQHLFSENKFYDILKKLGLIISSLEVRY